LDTRDKISTPIQAKINHLKDFYRSSRVSVFEFHNSLVNLNGLPFKWYDLIYESVARGVHAVSYETRNMPFNILLPIITKVENGNTVLFNKDDIEKYNQQLKFDYSDERFSPEEKLEIMNEMVLFIFDYFLNGDGRIDELIENYDIITNKKKLTPT
jgi:hypothetical protein